MALELYNHMDQHSKTAINNFHVGACRNSMEGQGTTTTDKLMVCRVSVIDRWPLAAVRGTTALHCALPLQCSGDCCMLLISCAIHCAIAGGHHHHHQQNLHHYQASWLWHIRPRHVGLQ